MLPSERLAAALARMGTLMATGEFKKLLDREFATAAALLLAEIVSPLLRELVDAGLMAFRRCEGEAAVARKEKARG